jgi:hypothetical protein
MSEESLIGDMPEADEASAPADISHVQVEKAPPAAVDNTGTEQWIKSVSETLYKDGKPNLEALPEKYWKDGTPDIGSALKARAELEKRFSKGEHKVPESYDTSFLTDYGVPDDDPLVGSFSGWAKENGVSQDAFQKLAQTYIDNQLEVQKSMRIDLDAERQKLGPNADKIIGEMAAWGQNMVKRGIWSSEEFDEFKIMGGTAKGLNALMKVREYYGDMQRIPVDVAAVSDRPSKDDLNAMIADPRYATDASYRSRVEKAFEAAYGE